jgi:hypothetical protein
MGGGFDSDAGPVPLCRGGDWREASERKGGNSAR